MTVTPSAPGVPRATVADLHARVRQHAGSGSRVLLGIAGAPGAGKSTVADAVTTAVGDRAVVLPMDGFHLADTELDPVRSAARPRTNPATPALAAQ